MGCEWKWHGHLIVAAIKSRCVFSTAPLHSLICGMNTEDPVKDSEVIGYGRTTGRVPGMTSEIENSVPIDPYWIAEWTQTIILFSYWNCGVVWCKVCLPWWIHRSNGSWGRSPEISIFGKPPANSEKPEFHKRGQAWTQDGRAFVWSKKLRKWQQIAIMFSHHVLSSCQPLLSFLLIT